MNKVSLFTSPKAKGIALYPVLLRKSAYTIAEVIASVSGTLCHRT
jgi:hypothetical protein